MEIASEQSVIQDKDRAQKGLDPSLQLDSSSDLHSFDLEVSVEIKRKVNWRRRRRRDPKDRKPTNEAKTR